MQCMGLYCMASMATFVRGEVPSMEQSLPLMILRATLASDSPTAPLAKLEAVKGLCDLAVSR